MSIDPTTPVVVLWVHHGSLGIARSLGRLGVPVHGVHPDPGVPACQSRYWQAVHRWNFATEPAERSLEFLLRLSDAIGRRAVLIPTSDHLAEFVAEHADRLRGRFLFQDNSPALVKALSHKRLLHELAVRHGVPTPATEFPTSVADVAAYAARTTFPVMLKASDGLRLQARTGKKMVIVHSAAELLEQYRRLEDPDHPDLMLQEYIPGGDDTIWMFNGYFDRASRCLMGLTGKKIRQHPIHTGATSLGICLPNETVLRQTADFMAAIGYQGILDIGWRFDARDGTYKLLDPNPRIGSTFRLFVGENGLDVARALYLDLTGQPVPVTTLRNGRRWMVEDQDLESALDYAAEGSLTLGDWLGSLPGLEEGAWFAWDDLRPVRVVMGGLVARAARRVATRLKPPTRAEARAPSPA
ncbi:MAG: hypothetical protein IT352_13655 [Gemmatimonadales bacterium]|nr:hypothetical protein [Gemmatimonadales bacterium]